MKLGQNTRMTTQRAVILEEVKKTCSHLTADEIYEKVRKRLPRISMGTVYRNLETLAKLGLITRLEPGRTQMRFDRNTTEHYHLTCVNCGAVEDASLKPLTDSLDSIENALGKLTKHGIFGHKLEFIGLCAQCQESGCELPYEEQ